MRDLFLICILMLLFSCQNRENKPENELAEPVANETTSTEKNEPATAPASEQEENIITLDDELQKLIPEDFVLFEALSGDLNKDSQEDYVLIVKATDEEYMVENGSENLVDRNRRGIIIAFKEGNGYRKVVENLTCFASENEDGGVYFPPELSLTINNKNNLEIDYGHGRYGYWGYIFRYQKNKFEMIGYHACSSRGPVDMSKVSVNFSTKKKKISVNTNPDGDSGEEVWEETWEDLEIDRLPNLQDIYSFEGLSF